MSRGDEYYAQGRLEESIQEYREGIICITKISSLHITEIMYDEWKLRNALAKLCLNNLQYNDAIVECELILKGEPFHLEAIRTLAIACRAQGNREKASEYLKRLSVYRSTNFELAALYEELAIPQPPNFPRIILSHVRDNKKEEVKRDLRKEGLVLNDRHIEKFFLLDPLNVESVKKLIEKFDRKRRYDYFVKYQIMSDLMEDPLLLEKIDHLATEKHGDYMELKTKLCPLPIRNQPKKPVNINDAGRCNRNFQMWESVIAIILGTVIAIAAAYYSCNHLTY